MKVVKQSKFIGNDKQNPTKYIMDSENDIINLTLAVNGRLRFGAVIDGGKGENIAGEYQIFTSSATALATEVITHSLGATPTGYLIISKNKHGDLYQVTATNTTISLVSSTTTTNYTIFLLK